MAVAQRSAAAPLPLSPALGRSALASCGTVFTWWDVRDWMAADGSWRECLRRGLCGRALIAAGAATPGTAALRERAELFRRKRRLVAREDLSAWLARWDVSDEEWVDWLERSLLVESFELDGHEPLGGMPEVDESVDAERDAWVDAVCSGALERAAWSMAEALGGWATATNGAPLPVTERTRALRDAYERLLALPVTDADLAREIATHAGSWMSLRLERADLRTVDAAREAVACWRDDGAPLARVAQLAAADLVTEEVRVDALEGPIRSVAVSAPVGAPVIVGTPRTPGLVVVVADRRLPDVGIDEDRELARRSCVEARVEAAVDRWVSWRD